MSEVRSAIGPVRTRTFGVGSSMACPGNSIATGEAVSAAPARECAKRDAGPRSTSDTDFGVLGLEWRMSRSALEYVGPMCAEQYDAPPTGNVERGPRRSMRQGNRLMGNVTDLVVGVQSSLIKTDGPIVQFGYGDKVAKAVDGSSGRFVTVWRQADDDDYYGCPLVRIEGTAYSCEDRSKHYELQLSFACPQNRRAAVPSSTTLLAAATSTTTTATATTGMAKDAGSASSATSSPGSAASVNETQSGGNGVLYGALAVVALALVGVVIAWRRSVASYQNKLKSVNTGHHPPPAKMAPEIGEKPVAIALDPIPLPTLTAQHKDQGGQYPVALESLYLPEPMPAAVPAGAYKHTEDQGEEELYIGDIPKHESACRQ